MKKMTIWASLFFALTLSTNLSAQSEVDYVIKRSNVVQLEPQSGMGYLVLKNPGDVTSWVVEVIHNDDPTLGMEFGTVVATYTSSPNMNFVRISSDYYLHNDHSFRISGYGEGDNLLVLEDHEVQAIGGDNHWSENDCKLFRCNGPDYAYQIKIFSHDVNGSYILQLDDTYKVFPTGNTSGSYYMENCTQTRFDAEYLSRGVQIGYNEGIDYMYAFSGPGQMAYTFQGNPINGPYMKLKKDAGPWRPEASAGVQTPVLGSSNDICWYTFDGAKNLMNSYTIELQGNELTCEADPGGGTSGGGGVNSSNPGNYAAELIDCLMDVVFPGIPDPVYPQGPFSGVPYNIYQIVTTIGNINDLEDNIDDCYGFNYPLVNGEPAVSPGVAQVIIAPLSIKLAEGEHFETQVSNASNPNFDPTIEYPEGLYVYGVLLNDGDYMFVVAESIAEPAPEVLDFSVSPNPAPNSSNVTVTLLSTISGIANVEIINVTTGVVEYQGTISNAAPFETIITKTARGPQSYDVRVFNATLQESQILVVQ